MMVVPIALAPAMSARRVSLLLMGCPPNIRIGSGQRGMWSPRMSRPEYGRSGGAASPTRIGGRNVEQPELHALLALPAVDRERACRMHGLPAMRHERRAELLADGAERNGVDAGTVTGAQP